MNKKEQLKRLAAFALAILDDWPDVANLDGGDIQELASKHGILVGDVRFQPCGEFCNCAEMVYDEEWKQGVTCYHIAEFVQPAAAG